MASSFTWCWGPGLFPICGAAIFKDVEVLCFEEDRHQESDKGAILLIYLGLEVKSLLLMAHW